MTTRLSWQQYFMINAHLISMRSTCERLNVGAVIVKDNQIIATGYNGGISGEDHCTDEGCLVVDNHCIRTIHAEDNAITQCAKFGISTKGATIYVTHFPCVHCMKKIIQAGITTVYYAKDYKNHDYCHELHKKSGIILSKIESDIEFQTFNGETPLGASGHLAWFFEGEKK